MQQKYITQTDGKKTRSVCQLSKSQVIMCRKIPINKTQLKDDLLDIV